MIILQRDLANAAYYDPTTNVLIPLWALIAYALAEVRTRSSGTVHQETV